MKRIKKYQISELYFNKTEIKHMNVNTDLKEKNCW